MTRIRSAITDDNRRWWTLGAMCFALFMICRLYTSDAADEL